MDEIKPTLPVHSEEPSIPSDEKGIATVAFYVAPIGGGVVQVWKGDEKLADTSEPPYSQYKVVWIQPGTKVTLKAIPLDDRYAFEYWLYNGNPVQKDAKHEVEIWGAGNQYLARFYRQED